MTVTEQRTNALMTALLAARRRVPARVHKAGKNEQQKYTYVGHEHVLVGGARDALLENDLVLLLESYELVGSDSYKTQSGDKQCWRWRGHFRLLHTSGEQLSLSYEATTVPNDKAGFVASTALDRTAHMRVLELAGSDEENPEHDSHEPPARRERKSKEGAAASARPLPEAGSRTASTPEAGDDGHRRANSQRTSSASPSSTTATSRNRVLPTDAEGWRAAHNAVCDQLFAAHDIAPGAADEYGLHVPTLPVPSFSAQAKAHAGKRYDDLEGGVKPGYLRSFLWCKEAFWRDATSPQRAWVSYLVARHELAKIEAEAAERALGQAGAA